MTIPLETEADIRRLSKVEGWSVGTIASQLNVHHSVVARVLDLKPNLGTANTTEPRPKLIDSHIDFIVETFERYPRLPGSRMYDMIKARGYEGSERTARRNIAPLRPVPQKEAYLRLSPIIGEQAQVDWARTGQLAVKGGVRPLWLFVAVLSWSRAMFAEFVFDLTADSLRRSLRRMGEFYEGQPRQWLFDNPKTVVLQRHGGAARLHPLLVQSSSDYCVQARLCAPRKGNEKGRVERAIRYLRSRFLSGRQIYSIEQGNKELMEFIHTIAHPRPHPTIPNRTVQTCFEQERSVLLELPQSPPCTNTIRPVAVDKTAFIRFDTNSYSVPPEFVGRTLTVVADDRTLRIVNGDTGVASHRRCWGRRQTLELPFHREAILKQKHAAKPAKGLDLLRSAAPKIDVLVERWVEAGYNVGSVISRATTLLGLYSPRLFGEAVDAVIRQGTHDVSAIALHCEQLRRDANLDVPIPVTLGDHVPEVDVIPHDLEKYDADI